MARKSASENGIGLCRLLRLLANLSNIFSCIKFYEHSCLKLFLYGPEAVFKQQDPCSNHGIHVLFDLGFELLISQDGPCLVYVTLSDVT